METKESCCIVTFITKLRLLIAMFLIPVCSAVAAEWPKVASVERQPLLAQVQRLQEAMEQIGYPLSEDLQRGIKELNSVNDDARVAARVQELLDPLCLAAVTLQRDAKPLVVSRGRDVQLVEQGWRPSLIKVINEPELRVRLRIGSPNAHPLPHAPANEVASRWLGLSMLEGQPLTAALSGLPLEYRLVEVFSRDAGTRSAQIEFAAPIPNASVAKSDASSLIEDWRFDKDAAGWQAMNQVELKVEKGSLFLNATGVDPFISLTLKQPAKPGNLVLRFWAKGDEAGFGQMFWWTEERPQPDAARLVTFNIEPGREMLYELPFGDDGRVTGLRIDPKEKPGKMRIDWIELAYADKASEWAGVPISFRTLPSTEVTLRVIDEADRPAMGCFEITDAQRRVYPPQSKRLAPDFFFQRQIYRTTGETVRLPAGTYSVKCSRGPESIPETQTLIVDDKPVGLEYCVRHWIDPSRRGYWSGDHHIHAAGCAHYENPTQGVHPPDMLRHCMGEDLKVGCCLTWGPCFDFQKRFFTGKLDDRSQYPYLLRYDVEVSGFGSHASGHLNLLRLRDQIPPGGDSKEHWPTLGLNTLRWAKRQGAVCGPAHSSLGLTRFVDRVPNTDGLDGPNGLPNFNIPAFDGIGANEFIMNVAHTVPGPDPDEKPVPAVDFISTMNSDRTAEFNIWYHTLNCGFRVRASGETDFPCMSGERVGLGRVYARLDGKLDFDRWCDALAAGRSYISDGRTHLMEFSAAIALGERPEGNSRSRTRESSDSGSSGNALGSLTTSATVGSPLEAGTHDSELKLAEPSRVKFTVSAAALDDDHRKLPVELIVNGYPVARQELTADGREQSLVFEHPFEKSSWAAIRVFPKAHTNPIFVLVNNQPIRANRHSAEWCLRCVDQCWKAKSPTYSAAELKQAKADYEHARQTYRKLFDEASHSLPFQTGR